MKQYARLDYQIHCNIYECKTQMTPIEVLEMNDKAWVYM